jgi:hypothetical protein
MQIPPNLEYHLRRMGFDTINKYQTWCSQNGFSSSLNKKNFQLKSEYNYVLEKNALFCIKKDNQKITLKKALELIKSGTREFKTPLFDKISDIYYDNNLEEYLYIDKKMFIEILSFLEAKTDILNAPEDVSAIANFLTKKDRWIRTWDSWKPNSYNAKRQFSSLVRHLFAKYPVPILFDQVWFKINNQEHEWFIAIAQGQNIVKAPGFLDAFPITKKMAHYFMQAPDTFDFKEALRYGQIKSFGGNDRLVQALKNTSVFRTYIKKDNDFIVSLIKFFIDNPMLDMTQIGPIVDYIWNQKFSVRNHIVNGQVEQQNPIQPNFSMTGRTVDTLLAQVERWHRQLGKEKKGSNLIWDHWDRNDFELIEGSIEKHNQKIWRIQQLLSSKELSVEGRYMRHCVASYATSCFRGSSSIWSLSIETNLGVEKLITIEVGKSPMRIYQTRGKHNRFPIGREKDIIRRWADKEGIIKL